MGGFAVELLTRPQVMEVFPLVRQLTPDLSLAGWRRHAAMILRDRSGRRGMALLRRDGQRFPCGLCAFRLDQDLALGRMLTAEHGVVMTSFGTHEAFDALVRGVHDLAVARGCGVVRWLLPRLPLDPAERPCGALLWARLPDEAPFSRQGAGPPLQAVCGTQAADRR